MPIPATLPETFVKSDPQLLATEKMLAFEEDPDCPNIAIKGDRYEFTRRWFKSRNQKTWSKFLAPKFEHSNNYRMLQIGVFEGMDLVWMRQNCMGPGSIIHAVDPWMATRKISQEEMNRVFGRACHNLGNAQDEAFTFIARCTSDVWFSAPSNPPIQYDLCVIDGDHTQEAVYKDAVNCLVRSKPGTWLLFDDVRNRHSKKKHVQAGLDQFREDFGPFVKTVWQHRFCDCLEVVEVPNVIVSFGG